MPTTPTIGAALTYIAQARAGLDDAARQEDAGERFRLAHLAALRVAAAVVADRGRPAGARRRLMNLWVLLDKVAPEQAQWAAWFAAGAQLRAAVEAGVRSAVTARRADDELRAAEEFLLVAERSLGLLAA